MPSDDDVNPPDHEHQGEGSPHTISDDGDGVPPDYAPDEGEMEEPQDQLWDLPTVTRAAWAQILHTEFLAFLGLTVRENNSVLSTKSHAQKENWKEHAQAIHEERMRDRAARDDAIADMLDARSALAEDGRLTDRKLLSQKRGAEQRWQSHGRHLQNNARALRQQMQAQEYERKEALQADGRALSSALKSQTRRARARILAENEASVAKVQGKGGALREGTVRPSKQWAVNGRWDAADVVRLEHEHLQDRRFENEVEYLAKAMSIKARHQVSFEEAKAKRQADKDAQAAELRRQEAEYDRQLRMTRAYILDEKRQICESMRADKSVPSLLFEEKVLAVDDDAELGYSQGSLAMFSRYFGFRKRGAGQLHSSAITI